ncbi:MAG: TIGR04552 family protein [Myxococcota bacterium]
MSPQNVEPPSATDASFLSFHDTVPDLADAEAIRIFLSGASCIDWNIGSFQTVEDVDQLLNLHLLDPNKASDSARLRRLYDEALTYATTHLKIRFPEAFSPGPSDLREVFLWASGHTRFRRTQALSCLLLKLLHVLQHLEAADLKNRAPISEAQLHFLADQRIMTAARDMDASPCALESFVGSKKTRSSVITKLLSKTEDVAARIFDKLRYRITVPTEHDLVPALRWLSQHLVPFNAIVPAQSHNSLLDLRTLRPHPRLGDPHAGRADVTARVTLNEFSGRTFRMINFIADIPVRLPVSYLPDAAEHLGATVHVPVEFQLFDRETAENNERGDNAHEVYKGRQEQVALRRLIRGAAEE